ILDCALIAAVVAALATVLSRTGHGRQWRAVCDDPLTAALCGVNVRVVFFGAILVGALTAALTGILAGFYFGNISFGTGLVFGLKILFVTAIGGYAMPVRAAAGAFAFGIAESLWTGYFAIEWRDAWMFAFLVAMLVLRPHPDNQARLG